MSDSFQLNKHSIKRAFNTASHTYDQAANWQKKVANQLLNYVDKIQPYHQTILDLGAGTGYLTKHLQQRHSGNHIIALDIAEQMLLFSKQHDHCHHFICSDAENLSLKNQCIHMILSNMALHWCPSLKLTLKEQYRVLKKNGILIFSLLGSESLQSLKTAWQAVDNYTHVNTFIHHSTIKQLCHDAGFEIIYFKRYEIKKHYKNVNELMQHLKATGAKTVLGNKIKGLMGKEKLKRLYSQYKNPLKYEIFTIVCQK